MSNFLRELQQIYVEDYRGDITNFPTAVHNQKAPVVGSPSYEGMPGATPNRGAGAYSINVNSCDEEERFISCTEIQKFIASLIEKNDNQISPDIHEILSFLKSHCELKA